MAERGGSRSPVGFRAAGRDS